MIILVNANAGRIPLADDSVHCVITSIPYWGLRDYGLPPLVWDGEEGCEHVWGEEQVIIRDRQHLKELGEKLGCLGGNKHSSSAEKYNASQGQFCQRCGAWRGCLGLEPSPDLYVSHVVQVFREIRRVMRADGTCWLNIGDSYNAGTNAYRQSSQTSSVGNWKNTRDHYRNNVPGLKPKDLCMIPSRVALALQADGWWIRSEIIWHKPNPMPGSMTDRPTTAHEKVFLLSKSARYFYDAEAIREPLQTDQKENYPARSRIIGRGTTPSSNQVPGCGPQRTASGGYSPNGTGRNKRTVWTIPTQPYKGAHFACFPQALVEPMIKAGTSERGVCPECGGPWERVIEREKANVTNPRPFSKLGNEKDRNDVGRIYEEKVSITTGWRPTCDHDHEPTPATVLDPFAGSGTTLLEARQLGRRGIGMDLSFDYLHDQARERLGFIALKEWENGKDGAGEPLEKLPLFAEVLKDG